MCHQHVLAASLLWLVTQAFVGGIARETDETADESRYLAMLNCGPHCVYFVQQSFGKEQSLISVIDSMKSSATASGHSVGSICDQLKTYQIFCAAVKSPTGNLIEWPHPMIAMVKLDGQINNHFVVILPETTNDIVFYWDGQFGYGTTTVRNFKKRFQGVLILTSDKEIDLERLNVMSGTPSRTESVFVWLVITVPILASLFLMPFFKFNFWRTRNVSSNEI
jgi:ABC-type bacteriocin/lantibiotic exporter with double-glycine peptidase domain